MGDLVPIGEGRSAQPTPPEGHPTLNGQTLFGAIVDEFAAAGVTLPRTTIAVAARHGASALKDGVEPEIVLAGCLVALRQGKGRYTQDYIAELAVVKAGQHLSTLEYQRQLERHKFESAPLSRVERIQQGLEKEGGDGAA